MSASDSIDSKLAQALAECERLQMENRQLREQLGIPSVDAAVQIVSESSTQVTVTSKSRPDEKVKLFRSLFRGREDVYAVRWEGRNGKAGYSPAYPKTWSNSFQGKPDAPARPHPGKAPGIIQLSENIKRLNHRPVL
jgi:hypothetical protein